MAVVITPKDTFTCESSSHFATYENCEISLSSSTDILPEEYTTELIDQGIGGTYLVRDICLNPNGIFKPCDEEPGTVGNPKGEIKRMKGIEPGMGAIREVVAYAMDKFNFAGVPKTMMNELSIGDKVKVGSYQEFVNNVGSVDELDLGSGKFDIENVQKIAQFDIRLLNIDRNCQNLLVVDEDNFELVPIDHSYILPNCLDVDMNFGWMNWRQVKGKVVESVIKYVESIDIEEDVEILRIFGIEEKSIRNMKLATLVLKRGCSVGWSLFKIAGFLVRNKDGESELEKIVNFADNESRNESEFWGIVEDMLGREIN